MVTTHHRFFFFLSVILYINPSVILIYPNLEKDNYYCLYQIHFQVVPLSNLLQYNQKTLDFLKASKTIINVTFTIFKYLLNWLQTVIHNNTGSSLLSLKWCVIVAHENTYYLWIYTLLQKRTTQMTKIQAVYKIKQKKNKTERHETNFVNLLTKFL